MQPEWEWLRFPFDERRQLRVVRVHQMGNRHLGEQGVERRPSAARQWTEDIKGVS